MCLTGRFINAETALNWGLISEIVEPGQLQVRSVELLKGI